MILNLFQTKKKKNMLKYFLANLPCFYLWYKLQTPAGICNVCTSGTEAATDSGEILSVHNFMCL